MAKHPRLPAREEITPCIPRGVRMDGMPWKIQHAHGAPSMSIRLGARFSRASEISQRPVAASNQRTREAARLAVLEKEQDANMALIRDLKTDLAVLETDIAELTRKNKDIWNSVVPQHEIAKKQNIALQREIRQLKDALKLSEVVASSWELEAEANWKHREDFRVQYETLSSKCKELGMAKETQERRTTMIMQSAEAFLEWSRAVNHASDDAISGMDSQSTSRVERELLHKPKILLAPDAAVKGPSKKTLKNLRKAKQEKRSRAKKSDRLQKFQMMRESIKEAEEDSVYTSVSECDESETDPINQNDTIWSEVYLEGFREGYEVGYKEGYAIGQRPNETYSDEEGEDLSEDEGEHSLEDQEDQYSMCQGEEQEEDQEEGYEDDSEGGTEDYEGREAEKDLGGQRGEGLGVQYEDGWQAGYYQGRQDGYEEGIRSWDRVGIDHRNLEMNGTEVVRTNGW